MRRNIALIGFMASGKTTVSQRIRQLTSRRLIDIDEEVIKMAGLSISEIFAKFGEDYFRRLETMALLKALSEEEVIISCGGGIVLKEENIEALRHRSNVVYLSATPKTVFERLRGDSGRPLAKGKSLEGIKELMASREEKYMLSAHMVIYVDNKKVDDIAVDIILRSEKKFAFRSD